jgi:hypothetical protein
MDKSLNRRRKAVKVDPNVLPKTFDSAEFVSTLREALDETISSADRDVRASTARSMFLSKYMDDELVSADVRETAAIVKWLNVERLNRLTNFRLYHDQLDTDFGWITSTRLIYEMRVLIQRTLGKAPSPKELRLSVTNGASTRINKEWSARYQKVSGSMHCSTSCLPLWLEFASGTLFGVRLANVDIELMERSMLLTVPKKTEIDRVIAKEPDCNALMQRGVGLVIRDRLLKVGLDIRDQTQNQRLALLGSQRGQLATIDFSSASDTLTTQLVCMLLPTEWWELMYATRVSGTVVNGANHDFELWSSMGNGYTFELETLVFWALARVVCRYSGVKGAISVYGDDVILPSAAAPRYMRIARWLGFLPNEAKSFVDGYYRESCGKHYNRGYDVTPFFVRGKVDNYCKLIGVLNQVLEWNCRGYGFFVDEPIFLWWKRWSAFVPRFLRGGWDPMDPGILVDGTRRPKRRIVPSSEVVHVLEDAGPGLSHPGAFLLAMAIGGEYSFTTLDHERFKFALVDQVGTVAYTPGLLFESER